MSGPKSSRYTLTAEQRKRLLEEQERLRKGREEQARKERQCKEARTFLDNTLSRMNYYYNVVTEQNRGIHSFEHTIPNEFLQKQNQYQTLCERLKTICTVKDGLTHSELMNAKKQAAALIEELAELTAELLSKSKEISERFRTEEDAKVSDAMQISFASVGKTDIEEDPVMMQTVNNLNSLMQLTLSKPLQKEVFEVLEQYKAIDDPNARENYSAITIVSLMKRCREYDRFIKAHTDEFENELAKHQALCQQLGIEEKDFDFSEEGLAELKALNAAYERQMEQQAEQAYISSTIDEVMQEMGYEVIGTRTVHKKSGKTFNSKLLTYEDGTVVNVTESSDGQITMEIGGVDSKDRLPDANERASLQKKMESFCQDFKLIEQRLIQKGVVLKTRISMAPPEEAYAQIINYTDYELLDEYRFADAKKQESDTTKSQKQIKDE